MNDNTIICVFGVKGSGKTTLVQEIVRTHRPPRVIIFDTVGQYGNAERAQVFYGLGPGAHAIVTKSRVSAFRISLRSAETGDLLRLMEVAYEVPDSLVVVEEASFFCSPSQLPYQLSQLVRLGRHRRISQVYVAQRPSEVHRAITAQADLLVSFRQMEDRDLMFLRGRFGPGVERLRELSPYRVMIAGDESKAPLPVLERLDSVGRPGVIVPPSDATPRSAS